MMKMLLTSPEASKALSTVQKSLSEERNLLLFAALRETYKKHGQNATVDDLPSLWRHSVSLVLDKEKNITGTLTKGAESTPGYESKRKVEDKHHRAILTALGAGIAGAHDAISQAVASAPTQGADRTALEVIVGQAIQHNVTTDPSHLASAIRAVHEDAGNAGLEGAAKQLRIPLQKPGKALQDLMAGLDTHAGEINGTTLSRIRTAIVDGIAQGSSASQIGDVVNAVIDDPTRASMIALTETNTAYNAASVDTYQQAGLPGWNWVAYDGACDECLDLEGFHDITDTNYPSDASHPNCRCGVEGAIE